MIIGTYEGFFQYDEKSIQEIIGHNKTFFKIEIDEFDGKSFKGKVLDDVKSGGMDGEGVIKGTFINSVVKFKKYMPYQGTIEEDGLWIDADKKHSTLYYTGKSFGKGNFKGTWKFGKRLGWKFGFIPMLYRPSSGTWEMAYRE